MTNTGIPDEGPRPVGARTPGVLPRSFLYVPGNRPELFDKAASGAADAVVLDLEDAVPLAQKDEARDHVARWLAGRGEGPHAGAQVWVRVDPESGGADPEAAAHPGLAGLFLAKCTPETLGATAATLAALESERGLDPVGTVGLVESAAALLALGRMAEHARLTTFGVGQVDLLADLRLTRSGTTGAGVDGLLLAVVLHAAAAGLTAPVAPTSIDFRDLDAFERSTRHLSELGFRSRTAIHPGQVPVIHDVLTPSRDEVVEARSLVERFDAAQGGVVVDDAGRMVDRAVVRRAHEVLGRARAAQTAGGQEPSAEPDRGT